MSRLKHPVRSIREPFGTAGLIVAIVALVAALGGTALAAKGALTGKQTKEVEKIAKKYAGKNGTNGTNGPNGAPGANGKDGANGSNGANGQSVNVSSYTGEECETAAGEEGAELSDGAGTAFVCNGAPGPQGSPWTDGGVLPTGATETGAWAVVGPALGAPTKFMLPVSIPIRLPANVGVFNVNFINSNGQEIVGEVEQTPVSGCSGTVLVPSAPAGKACIYIGQGAVKVSGSGADGLIAHRPNGGLGLTPTGGYISGEFEATTERSSGSWAVTAP
jgi:hypothetical protein